MQVYRSFHQGLIHLKNTSQGPPTPMQSGNWCSCTKRWGWATAHNIPCWEYMNSFMVYIRSNKTFRMQYVSIYGDVEVYQYNPWLLFASKRWYWWHTQRKMTDCCWTNQIRWWTTPVPWTSEQKVALEGSNTITLSGWKVWTKHLRAPGRHQKSQPVVMGNGLGSHAGIQDSKKNY